MRTFDAWIDVHAGDHVYGMDGREWTVVWRGEVFDHFAGLVPLHLRHGDRMTVATVRNGDAAPLAARADHSRESRAVQALINAGLNPKIIEERIVTEVNRDRWGRYLLPRPDTGVEQAWTRATTIASTLADTYGLSRWGERMVAKGMASRPDLVELASATDDRGELDRVAKDAKEHAGTRYGSNRGTAFHAVSAALDGGAKLADIEKTTTPAMADAARRYNALLSSHGINMIPGMSERIVCSVQLDAAGTLDRLVTDRDGATRVLDVKTGKDLSYSAMEIAIQLAIYANADAMYSPELDSCPMPTVEQDYALVAHVPLEEGRPTELYAVNIAHGWELAKLAYRVREERKVAKGLLNPQSSLERKQDGEVAKAVLRAPSREALASLWDRYAPQGMWTDAVHALAQNRLREINT